jgi:hypothetical protein
MRPEEVRRLIDIIVEEMAAAAPRSKTLCACHSVLDDCCPDRLRGVIDAGATRVGLYAAGGAPDSIASLIDHTLLKPDATRQQIEEVCREALQFKFATVCVNPTWVATCSTLLRGRGVGVCPSSASAGRDDGRCQRLRNASRDVRWRHGNRHGGSTWARSSPATCASSSAISRQ